MVCNNMNSGDKLLTVYNAVLGISVRGARKKTVSEEIGEKTD